MSQRELIPARAVSTSARAVSTTAHSTAIPLPRLSDGTPLHPARAAVTLRLRPTSRATLLLPPEERPALRDTVELFTPQGSAGLFRVTAVEDAPGEGCEVTLRHTAASLADALIPGSGELNGPARQVLAAMLSCQTGAEAWTLGDVELPDDRALQCQYDNTNLMTALMTLMDELPECGLFFDQSERPWRVHLRLLSDADACECRLSRNLRSVSVSLDDSELCTRVYVKGLAAPVDADAITTWGPVSRCLTASRRLPPAALTALARRYLEQHSQPALTVRLDAIDLHRATGEAFDRFPPGRVCRVCLPGDGRVIRQRVVSVEYPDVYGDPERATVTLAARDQDAADYVGGLMASVHVLYRGLADADGLISLEAERIELLAGEIQLKASHEEVTALEKRTSLAEITLDGLKAEIALKASQESLSAMGTRLSQAEIDISGAKADILLKASREEVTRLGTRLSQAEVDIDGAKADIRLKASQEEVTRLGTRLSQAEIDIDGANASIALKASRETVDALTGRVAAAESSLTVQAGQIALKVSAGGIASAINQTPQEVQIQASKINLSGYVTASQLSAEVATFDNLVAGRTEATHLRAAQGSFGSLIVGGSAFTSRRVTYVDAGGTAHTLNFLTNNA